MSTAASPGRFPGLARSFSLLREFSAFLLIGTAVALLWANVGHESYAHFVDEPLILGSTLEGWAASGGLLAALGALLSFAAGPGAWALSKVLKVKRMTGTDFSDAADMEPAESLA